MPPWPADPKNSLKFRNDPRLSQHEIDTLVAWVKAGTPKGQELQQGKDPAPPVAPSQGWLHPKGLEPDVVIQLASIPSAGLRRNSLRPSTWPRFRFRQISGWLRFRSCPSNRAVVHHMAVTEVSLDPRLDSR